MFRFRSRRHPFESADGFTSSRGAKCSRRQRAQIALQARSTPDACRFGTESTRRLVLAKVRMRGDLSAEKDKESWHAHSTAIDRGRDDLAGDPGERTRHRVAGARPG